MRILFTVRPYQIHAKRTIQTQLVQSVDRSQFEPVVFTNAPGPACDWFRDQGIETTLCPLLDDGTAVESLAEMMKAAQIDLVQTESYNFHVARAARHCKISHVFVLGTVMQQGIRNFQSAFRLPVLAALDKLSKRIICPSEFIASPLRQAGVEHVQVIPNGVDLTQLQPRPTVLNGANPVIAMVAHFLPAKRHLDFIQAAHKVSQVCPEARFVIFGEAYDWPEAQAYHHQVLAAARELGVLRLSRFDGAAASEMDLVDIVVLPSIEEGFGNVILEAMARGLPVVASNQGGIPEIVVAEETGLLVPPRDVEALSRGIIELITNPERARGMGLNGRRRAEKHYCIRSTTEEYQRAWRELEATRT